MNDLTQTARPPGLPQKPMEADLRRSPKAFDHSSEQLHAVGFPQPNAACVASGTLHWHLAAHP